MDPKKLQDFCNQLDVKFINYKSDIYEILKHYRKNDGRIDCSRCSKLKRGAIVNYAKDNHYNKIAFAHHGDDAIETLFMNMMTGGKLNSFSPKIIYEDNNITFIRPLIYMFEKDIISYAKLNKLQILKNKCPNDKNSNRLNIKMMLDDIYLKNTSAHHNFLNILINEIWTK